MNESQYQAICDACDSLLASDDSSFERVAIHHLHVIREHPTYLGIYESALAESQSLDSFLKKIVTFLRRWLGRLLGLFRSLFSDGSPWLASSTLPSDADVLFVSHLVNERFAGKATDFYFGALPEMLRKSGKTIILGLLNHTSLPHSSASRLWREGKIARAIFSRELSILSEIKLLSRLVNEKVRLRRLLDGTSDAQLRSIVKMAISDVLSGATLSNLRKSEQIGSLIQELKPKIVVITFEGHAWERLVIAKSKELSPNTLCIGYAHGAIFRLQHAIRRDWSPEYTPDQIYSAGSVGRLQLSHSRNTKKVPIHVLGSTRHVSHKDRIVVQHERNTCLVIPDGIISECALLFRFSIECAKRLSQVNFIWRLHPILSFEEFFSLHPELKNIPKNVTLSKKLLQDDIRKSDWALYRGSTAIIQAVQSELRPIYLALEDELGLDPLYEIEGWKKIVRDCDEFSSVVLDDIAADPELLREESRFSVSYASAFYMPLNPDVINRSLSDNDKNC